MIINWKPTRKQYQALEILQDHETTELLYGGGAGGGKSHLGCAWLILNCLQYPGSRWLLGRAVLKTLKQTTLLTFFDICKEWELIAKKHYVYNEQRSVIKFYNGSEIYLKDLFLYPTDPEFDSLGSSEFTGAFIDEASQVTVKAKNIVSSRIRYKLDQFGIIPKTLIASNPAKNFMYTDFYKASKKGTIKPYRQFLSSLVTDNPHISPHYIENLKKLPKNEKERLLHGNWEYDDDPARLFEYDDLTSMFTMTAEPSEDKYISCDVARFGNDRILIGYWKGLLLSKIWVYKKKSIEETKKLINDIADKYHVKRNQHIIDEDGVGGGVVDGLPGVKGFVNNGRPIGKKKKDKNRPTTNYKNLKAQCYFWLSDYVRMGKIGIYKDIPPEWRDQIIEELEQIKEKDAYNDSPKQIVDKETIKENIGRSPDFADMIMMRMFFELKKHIKLNFDFMQAKEVPKLPETEEEKEDLRKKEEELANKDQQLLNMMNLA